MVELETQDRVDSDPRPEEKDRDRALARGGQILTSTCQDLAQNGQLHARDRIPAAGFLGGPGAAAGPGRAVPPGLPGGPAGEPPRRRRPRPRPPPPHAQVLLPRQPVRPRPLPRLRHPAQLRRRLPDRPEIHLPPGLCHASPLVDFLWIGGVGLPHDRVLRPLRGHLPPPALRGPHEPGGLREDGGGLSGLPHPAAAFSGPSCGSNAIRQFFRDIPQKLSGSNADLGEVGVTTFTASLSTVCFASTTVSYVGVFGAVLRTRSAEGRAKAFSTCLPRLAVVTFFISTSGFAYLKPPSDSPSTLDLLVSAFYSAVPPTSNPLIYSLRNGDVKAAIWKTLSGRSSD
ncbi:uncharacterized protein LOC100082732 [Ornithorhynchus anatinus]|uniref:uncharacterized protein LOC100082732 n=1 Tax=Ornithorhynchus anatinus TaxID=9258 RepID=UPI0019D45A3A|nr:uncharacterized protein LOC100082732 [Ornithorhynchus anatinus]